MPANDPNLTVSDRRLVTILDAMLVGTVIIDPWAHSIVYANDESAEMMGYRAPDLLGHVCHNFICPATAGHCPITDLRQEIDRSERCLLDREGRQIPILKTVRKIEFNGRVHYLETFMNISEFKEKERLLGALEMAGAAAHHLGQPLQVLTTSARLLLKKRSQETVDALNAEISSAIRRIQTIIVQIQNITRYETEEYLEGKRIVDIQRSSSAD